VRDESERARRLAIRRISFSHPSREAGAFASAAVPPFLSPRPAIGACARGIEIDARNLFIRELINRTSKIITANRTPLSLSRLANALLAPRADDDKRQLLEHRRCARKLNNGFPDRWISAAISVNVLPCLPLTSRPLNKQPDIADLEPPPRFIRRADRIGGKLAAFAIIAARFRD